MIIADDEFVKVSGVLLPGVFKSMDITGSALVEEIEIEGKGKKPKQATGYEDAKINIELILMDDENKSKYDKLAIIQSLFKEAGQKKPKVYDFVNTHATERNIGKVVFKELGSKETNKKDELIASLLFWEYEDIKLSTAKSTSTARSTLTEEYQTYLENTRGQAPRIKDKTTASPAYGRYTEQ